MEEDVQAEFSLQAEKVFTEMEGHFIPGTTKIRWPYVFYLVENQWSPSDEGGKSTGPL